MDDRSSYADLLGEPAPDVAIALRTRTKPIVDEWVDIIRRIIPQLSNASYEEACDHVPTILTQIAAVLEATSPNDV